MGVVSIDKDNDTSYSDRKLLLARYLSVNKSLSPIHCQINRGFDAAEKVFRQSTDGSNAACATAEILIEGILTWRLKNLGGFIRY